VWAAVGSREERNLGRPQPPGRVTWTQEDEDGDPYNVHGGMKVPCCASCGRDFEPGTVVCLACGFNQQTAEKTKREYQPLEREWETGLPYQKRMSFFVGAQVMMFVCGAFSGLLAENPDGFLTVWGLFAAMLGFVLGTYERINLTRTRRGQCTLTKTWRVFFYARPTQKLSLDGYEGIVTGRVNESLFWEWFIFVMLIITGVVPGLIWYYVALYTPTFYVALARDHGHPETFLYRGTNQDQMREMATDISDAVGMAYLRTC
jgi:hypothetical protein